MVSKEQSREVVASLGRKPVDLTDQLDVKLLLFTRHSIALGDQTSFSSGPVPNIQSFVVYSLPVGQNNGHRSHTSTQ